MAPSGSTTARFHADLHYINNFDRLIRSPTADNPVLTQWPVFRLITIIDEGCIGVVLYAASPGRPSVLTTDRADDAVSGWTRRLSLQQLPPLCPMP